MQRNGSWDGRLHIAKQLTFSSFSDDYFDSWSRHLARTYQIVLLPGYAPPEGLDHSSKDAMWFEGEVVEIMPVWDGFSSLALFEVIYECMDYLGDSPFIKIRDIATGAFVSETRSQESLRLRPRRHAGMHPKEVYNHILDLRMWGDLFNRVHDSGNHEETGRLYRSLILPSRASENSGADYQRRVFHAKTEGLDEKGLRDHERSWSGRGNAILSEGPWPEEVPSLYGSDRQDIEVFPLSWFVNSRGVSGLEMDDLRDKPRPQSLLKYAKSLDG